MWNEPTPEELHRLPRLYETEKTPWRSKLIYEHFFIGGCDWWAAEYDPANRLFFGYAMLHRDYDNAEWGYFSFDEMRAGSRPQPPTAATGASPGCSAAEPGVAGRQLVTNPRRG